METEYNFKATKRMYNTRLNQWNIRKNYRAEEKELLASRIAQAHLQSRPVSEVTFKGRPVKLHRVLRHIRDPKRGKAVRQNQRLPPTRTTDDEGTSDSSSASNPVRDDDMVRVCSRAPEPSCATPVESGNTTSSLLTPSSSGLDDDMETFEIIQRDELHVEPPPPSPPIFPPKDNLNMELLLHQTRSYYLDVMGSSVTDSFNSGSHVVDNTTVFWSNVKSGIYFLKKQFPNLAWPLLNEACVLAGDVFAQTPVLFLNSVFTVLSPINTRVYPQVRSTLLRYLSSMAAIKLKSRQHPLAVICREIARDGALGEASEAASNLTLALCTQTLGRDHGATFAVHRSLISLLRRAKRLDAAKRQGETLVNVTEQALTSSLSSSSSRSSVDIYHRRPAGVVMTDLCTALTELVHVHMDLGQHAVARGLCSSVIQNYQTIQGVHFPDTRAAYAMEDMAELGLCLGDRADAVYWLRQALDASCMLRGEADAATQHVRDKLRGLTDDDGGLADLESLDV
ncbi:Clr5 domain-containing protein [Cladophialophora immunda]|nr:Clr5 domain-containing protein [Cladophialophora immunda]